MSKNKFFATTATAALVASAIVPAASAAELNDFNLVPDYAKEAVKYLADNDFVQGDQNQNFKPASTLTRAQAAEIISKVKGLEAEGTEDFSDVKAGDWYYNAVVATSPEIFEGDGTGKFNPKKQLTRQEAAQIIVKAFGLTGSEDLSSFPDASKVPAWAKASFETAVANGIIKGKGEFLAPADNISNAEFAVMIKRSTDVDALEVIKVSAIDNITINEGQEVTFPETVEVTLSNDAKVQKDVEWNVSGLDTNKPGEYVVKGDVAGTDLEASVKVIVEEIDLEVTSVSGINATQIKVVFNKKVDEASATTNPGTLYTLTALDNQGTTTVTGAKLSEDGKSVTLTVDKVLEKRYQVKFSNIESAYNENMTVDYDEVVTFAADTVAPTVTGFEQINENVVRIKFSEPVQALAHTNITYKDAEGKTITTKSSNPANGEILQQEVSAGNDYFDLDLSKIDAGKKVTVTFNGLLDQAGNLVNPQPASIVVEKKELAEFAPTISSITQTGAKTFNIKFSADLDGTLATDTANYATNIVLDPANLVTNVEKVSDSEYKVTVTNNLDGVTTVKVLKTKVVNKLQQTAGATGTIDKVVTFTENTDEPVATTKLAIDKTGKEVIELSFDPEVTLAGDKQVTLSGSYVKDHITTPVSTDVVAVYADGTGENKKVVHIPLTTGNLNVEGAVYDLTIVNKASNTNGIVSDANVAIDTTEVTFTRGKDGSVPATNNHVLDADDIVVAPKANNNNQVTVTFTVPNGTSLDAATASNVANYAIAGAEIVSVSVEAVNGTTQVVTLNLKENSNDFTGVRNATVKNIKIAGSTKIMEPVTEITSAPIKENVLPTIESAEISGAKQITLTFSESIDTVKGNDFLVKAGTTTLALAASNAVVVDSDDTKVIITLNSNIGTEELAQTITVAPSATASNFEVKDTAGNVLATFEPITVVKP